MALRYLTREGDTIDIVCWKHYGATSGVVEQVIEANPGIEDLPVLLPPAIEIELPDLTVPEKGAGTVRLWD